jgi:DNA-binding YbaB/EbfC family protein
MTDAGQDPAAGGFDLGSLLGAASQMMEAQAQAAQQAVVGTAGGGAVKITVTGAGAFTGVEIDASVVDPGDVSMLEDLVHAALHDAMAQVNRLQSGALGGLDLGGLQGLLGAAGPAPDDDEG